MGTGRAFRTPCRCHRSHTPNVLFRKTSRFWAYCWVHRLSLSLYVLAYTTVQKVRRQAMWIYAYWQAINQFRQQSTIPVYYATAAYINISDITGKTQNGIAARCEDEARSRREKHPPYYYTELTEVVTICRQQYTS